MVLSVLLYVDDILYAGTKAALDLFETTIKTKFQIKSTLQATSYLGIDIAQHPQHVTLSQPKYINEAVERFGLRDAKPVKTPIILNKPETTAPLLTDKRLYQSILGVLLYINLTTRPDISYATHYLTRYAASPTSFHLKTRTCLSSRHSHVWLALSPRPISGYPVLRRLFFC